ncbi:MAG: hypothetical protein H7Z21_05985 [Hymenobacter sp.]|nr:hypothetical protein [Hymenobacter sp.]
MPSSLHHSLHQLLVRFGFTATEAQPDFFRREGTGDERPYLATTTGRRQLLLTQGPRVVLQADVVTAAALEQALTQELGESGRPGGGETRV